MADDASFHSCCEELLQHQQHHHNHHNNRHHQHQPHCRAAKDGGGGYCCCYSSDTDDEAQFLTASNSPLSLEASSASAGDCFGESSEQIFSAGGGFVGCLGGDLERTLGGDSEQNQLEESPLPSLSQQVKPTSPGGSSSRQHHILAPTVVASSTVTAAQPPSSRPLDFSGFYDVEGDGDGDGDENAGGNGEVKKYDNEEEDDSFPPPLASSSRASLGGLRSKKKPPNCPATTAVGPMATTKIATATSVQAAKTVRLDITDHHEKTVKSPPHIIRRKTESNSTPGQQYYQDNDLTPHRPPARRTRSGPMPRIQNPFESALRDFTDGALAVQPQHRRCHQHQLHSQQQKQQQLLSHLHHQQPPLTTTPGSKNSQQTSQPPPPAPPSTTTKVAVASTTASTDCPARLRKRVRFADALGFDLASVVMIAGSATAACAECCELFEAIDIASSGIFAGFCLTPTPGLDSELNRGRLFGTESSSQSPSCSMSVAATSQLHQPQQEDANWTSTTPWNAGQVPTPDRPVALESVRFFADAPLLEVSARVLNLAPQKCVTARVTFDNWRHQSDWSLAYCDGDRDRDLDSDSDRAERFQVRLPVPVDAAVFELALRYSVAGREHWDNNAGRNYMFVYRRGSTSNQLTACS